MSELWRLSASALAAGIRRGDFLARDVLDACRDRLHEVDGRVGAYLRRFEDSAFEQARDVDSRRRQGLPLGALAGVPLAIKDNLSLANHPLTCGSKILAGYTAPYTATAVERMVAADAVLLGATRLDAFAMGSSGESCDFGITRNPWHLGRVPGGSSSGSAAAVAAGTVPLALGSDTGGSVRQPAAFCGVVGLRPTYGRVSRSGLTAFASSMDQIGPLARCTDDVALALQVISGVDPRDGTTRSAPTFDRQDVTAPDLRGLKLGILAQLEDLPCTLACHRTFHQSLQLLEDLGAKTVVVSVPNLLAAVACYYVISSCEASTNLARFDGMRFGRRADGKDLQDVYQRSRGEGFGAEAKRRIMLGTHVLSSGDRGPGYERAQGVRHALRQQMLEALSQVDLLLTPTTLGGAFVIGQQVDDPLSMVLSDRLTSPASLAGLPALSVPNGRDEDGLPLGLQIMGRPFDEAGILGLGRAFEDAIEWQVEPGFVEPISNQD